MRTADHYKIIKRLHAAEGESAYCLDVFGDHIAERENYKELQGIEAIQFYLVTKFHWLPSQVRCMSHEDMRFVLTEEMSGWTLPKDARD